MHSIKISSILLCIFIFLNSTVQGQEEYKRSMQDLNVNFYDVCAQAEAYFQKIDINKKGSGWKNFQRWKYHFEPKYYPSGNRKNINYLLPNDKKQKMQDAKTKRTSISDEVWVDLGPHRIDSITHNYNAGLGRIECFEIDKSNTNIMYIGSRSGGFWKTSDGGASWKNTTDRLETAGVYTMDMNPNNYNEILISSNQSWTNISNGIFRSTDAGETWQPTIMNPENGFGGLGSQLGVKIIAYHPLVKDLVFIGTTEGLFRSTDNLQSFDVIIQDARVSEIAFHPTNKDLIYVYDSNSNNPNAIEISKDMGISFTKSANIIDNNGFPGSIAVSKLNPTFIYYTGREYLYVSKDYGANFQKLGKLSSNVFADVAISDINSQIIIGGYVNAERSTNGGLNFTEITDWNNKIPDSTYIHADLVSIQCIGGVFYATTDGYLAKSLDNGSSWTRLNEGTCIREFYKIGNSQSNENVTIGGSQDSGSSIRSEDTWIEFDGADGTNAIVHPINSNYFISSYQFGSRSRTLDGGLTKDFCFNPETDYMSAGWTAPLLIDPDDQMMVYHAGTNLYKNKNWGEAGSWEKVGSPNMGAIKNAAFGNINANILVTTHNTEVMVSDDKGKTWKNRTSNLPNFYISTFGIDPKHDSTLVVGFSPYETSDKNIFISHNLGSTWTNITYNLGGIPINDILIDHSQERIIYLATEVGVFYKPMKGNSWELFGTKLPGVAVNDLDIHYASNSLTAGTWGRGLWKTSLKGRANFPKIKKIDTSEPITIESQPINLPMEISALVDYPDKLQQVYLQWSHDDKSLGNKIPFVQNNNTWKSTLPIPTSSVGGAIFFKVFAIGNQQDTTESYTFMYRQGNCINQNYLYQINACDSVMIGDLIVKESGQYNLNLKGVAGCDSIVTYKVHIDSLPNNMITVIGNQLQAVDTTANNYQWLDCDNDNAIIEGEVKTSFAPSKSGNYALLIKNGICESTSPCISFIVSNLDDIYNSQSYKIIPNPSDGGFMIKNIQVANDQKLKISIIDTHGREVFQDNISENTWINTQLPSGIYIVSIGQRNKIILKLVIL